MHARNERILHLVAEEYVQTAKPVASAAVARELDVSSATVRNAFAALEEAGLLQQPHTSAGRIPTAAGFGVYARDLLPPAPISSDLAASLRRRFAHRHGDDLLDALARAVAELSGYAVVVSVPSDDRLHALEIHLTALHARGLLAVVVLENGLVRQVRVDLDPGPDEDVLDDAERQLRQLTLPVAAVPAALAALARGAEPELARTLDAIRAAWPAVTPPRHATAGLAAVLQEPEAQDPAFVRLLVERVERPATGPSLDAPDDGPDGGRADGARDGGDPGRVGGSARAGVEDGLELAWDATLALVRTAWRAGAARGQLTLIGPARLRYRPALQVVAGVRGVLQATAD